MAERAPKPTPTPPKGEGARKPTPTPPASERAPAPIESVRRSWHAVLRRLRAALPARSATPRPAAPPSGPRAPRPARRPGSWQHGALPKVVVGVAILALLGVIVSYPLDRHLRSALEAKMNSNLRGYKVSLEAAHLRLVNLGLSLNGLVIRQEANPEPPVAIIPHLKASVEWHQLLTGHLVADAAFVRPRLHVNLPQLMEEAADKVPLRQRGWQQAFQSIYPLKFNRVSVIDGAMTYVDADPASPLEVTRFQLEARNIRNIQSHDRTYPSPLHVQAVLFGSGRAEIDGNADFLAEPFMGVQGRYVVSETPIDRFQPIVARANVLLRGGVLSSRGEFEHGPRVYLLHVQDLTIRGAHADYSHGSKTVAAETRRAVALEERAKRLSRAPDAVFRVDELHLADSDIGLINRDKGYRVYVNHADLEVTNLSNRPGEGPAKARLRGRFMGSGTGHAEALFREGKSGPDFELSLAVDNTPLTAMNDVLRPYLNFTADGGTFALYLQLRVSHGRVEGYIKPMFRDLEVHRDEQGGLGHKIYNGLMRVASKVLENRKSDLVATEVKIEGSVNSPKTSVWQIVGNLVQNAFFKTILPGFEKQSRRLPR